MRGLTRALSASVLSIAIIAGPVAGSASAARSSPGKPTGSSSTLALEVITSPGDGLAHHGYTVTFNVSTTATKPIVQLDCTQAGTPVYQHSAGFYDEYPWPWHRTFELQSSAWTSGAADCVATLYHANKRGGFVTDATLAVSVLA